MNAEVVIAIHATKLAAELPAGLIGSVAEAINDCAGQDWPYARLQILRVAPQPQFRAMIDELLAAWRSQAPDIPPHSVALALLAASAATERSRQEQSVELVWTGPGVAGIALRRTDQALLQVIDAAQHSLLVISFAVYRIPAITEALIRAAGRGVSLRICVEAPEPSGQRMAYDTLQALGQEVRQRAAVYIWPRDQRLTSPDGRTGSLHAKCAVADDDLLFISSANLTEYAMSLNMELGVLIRGGPLPGKVAEQFQGLVESGVLRKIEESG